MYYMLLCKKYDYYLLIYAIKLNGVKYIVTIPMNNLVKILFCGFSLIQYNNLLCYKKCVLKTAILYRL